MLFKLIIAIVFMCIWFGIFHILIDSFFDSKFSWLITPVMFLILLAFMAY